MQEYVKKNTAILEESQKEATKNHKKLLFDHANVLLGAFDRSTERLLDSSTERSRQDSSFGDLEGEVAVAEAIAAVQAAEAAEAAEVAESVETAEVADSIEAVEVAKAIEMAEMAEREIAEAAAEALEIAEAAEAIEATEPLVDTAMENLHPGMRFCRGLLEPAAVEKRKSMRCNAAHLRAQLRRFQFFMHHAPSKQESPRKLVVS